MKATQVKSSGKRRTPGWEWLVAGLVGLVALVVFALPPLIRWAALDWLHQQGVEEARIKEVRLNLFRGQAALVGLYVRDDGYEPLEVERFGLTFSWGALFNRRAEVTDVSLEGATVPVVIDADGGLHVGIAVPRPAADAEPPSTEPAGEPWGFALRSVRIDNSRVSLRMPEYSGSWQLQHLTLEDLVSWQPGESAILRVTSQLNDELLSVQADLQPFAQPLRVRAKVQLGGLDLAQLLPFAGDQLQELSGSLSLDLDTVVENGPAGLQVQPAGEVQLSGLRVTDAQGRKLAGNLRWQGKADVRLSDGQPNVQSGGSLRLSDLSLEDETQQLAMQLNAVDWRVDLQFGGDESRALSFSGPLQLAGAALEVPAHRIALERAVWQGQGVVQLGEAPAPQVTGSLEAGGFSLLQKTGALRLAQFETLQVNGLTVDGLENQSVEGVELGALQVLQSSAAKRPEVVRLGALQTGPIRRVGNELRVGQVTLDNLVADILRSPDGSIAVLSELQQQPAEPVADAGSGAATETDAAGVAKSSADAQSGESDAEPVESTEPMRIVVQGLQVTGDSRLRFADRKVEPRFATEHVIEKLQVGAIDTANPAVETPVEAVLRTPGEGRITLQGAGRFLEDPLSLQFVVKGRSLELANLSPYAIQTIGYQFGTGQLNLDTKINIDAGKIRGGNKIHLRRFNMEKANASAAEKLASNLTMSLESALSLLRDSDGDIKLEIPLSGDLSNPEVDVQDAINKALGKAVRKAAFSYLKYTLQPYGSLITVVEVIGKAGEKLSALKLAPVEFIPGAVVPDAEGRAYLGKVAGLLKQRPEVTIKLCGAATPADQAALDAAAAANAGSEDGAAAAAAENAPADRGSAAGETMTLREIAEARSLNTKKVLVSELGVDASQLFLCAPKVYKDEDEKPAVQMQV